ncbi:ISNCY family transposase [Vibrio sp. 404]|uniref:ISNCY family transposase n=1 Tax=Vibrio marinisediminis TaxID=2758441 RepID=A0A7W2FUV3_9VIBR|nr:ISNCY family transposase [Vibrio marinisediminis]MBA5764690.1 ISNCY family transposase [Vibrio marinisediminis]
MNDRELQRLTIIQDVLHHNLSRRDALKLLGLSYRQLQRLITRFIQQGAASLAHGNRGKPSSNRVNESVKLQALELIHQHYSDFGPTLAHEKIQEIHGISVSLETLRQWMIADGLWTPHYKRNPRVYQPRYRRDCLGELIQIDGSHHDWFEGRSDKCCLLVFIDDATGRLMNLTFCETESAFDYMLATREYLNEHGKPVAFYSDKHSIFRVNQEKHKLVGQTQYARILNELGIELICANSSQAKGRVERANKTLQDRLVKEMRLRGISTIEEANAWLPDFINDFNRRFAKPAKYPKDLHRKVRESDQEINDIFSWQEVRKLSKSLTIQYDKVIYLIEPSDENSRLAHESVKVLDYPNGEIAIVYGHRKLSFKTFDKLEEVHQAQIVDNKRLGQVLKFAQQKQEEFEQQQKRTRSKNAPKRRAQQRALQEQLRTINPVLTNPEQFKTSGKKT